MSWHLAYRNLQRNKRRTFSTGLAICVGFVALNLLGAYLYRVYEVMTVTSIYMAQMGHFSLQKEGAVTGFNLHPKKYILTKSELDELNEKVLQPLKEEIEYTSSSLSGPALLSNGTKSHPVVAIGFEPEPYVRSLKQPKLLDQASDWLRPWQKAHADMYLKVPDLIAITPVIAEVLSFHIPMDKTESAQLAGRTLDGDLNAINVEIGAEHSTGSRFLEETIIMVPLRKLQELLGTEGIQSISLFLNSDVNLKSFEKILKEKARSLSYPLHVFFYTDEAINPIFESTMSFLYVMVFFFVLLICSAVSLTIVNALTMGIIERTREIGTLRAMGFTQKAVRQVFSRESLLVSLFSMLAGTVLSFIIAKAINAAEIEFQPPGTSNSIFFAITWNLMIALGSGAVLTLVAWTSAQIVIRRKSKTKLILLLHDIGESE